MSRSKQVCPKCGFVFRKQVKSTETEETLKTAFDDRQAALIREQDAHEKTHCSLWAAEECISNVRALIGARPGYEDIKEVIDQWAEKVINGCQNDN